MLISGVQTTEPDANPDPDPELPHCGGLCQMLLYAVVHLSNGEPGSGSGNWILLDVDLSNPINHGSYRRFPFHACLV